MPNISKMKFVKLEFDEQTMLWLDNIESIYSGALSLWFRAFEYLKNNRGKMSERALMTMLVNRKRGSTLVKQVLESSGDFCFEDNMVFFSESVTNRFAKTKKENDTDSNVTKEEKPSVESKEETINNDSDTDSSNQGIVEGDLSTLSNELNGGNSPHLGGLNGGNSPHLDELNGGNSPHLDGLNGGNSPHLDGSKARTYKNREIENRELENKESFSNSVSMLLAQTENANEIKFYQYLLKNYPNVCKMKIGITWEQYAKLRKKGYSEDTILSILAEMENRSDLTKKYRSAYLTLSCWLRIDKQRRERRTGQSSG